MKFALLILAAVLAIGYFTHRASTASKRETAKARTGIAHVGDMLARASSGGPLDGRQAPDARWVEQMTAACSRREQRLAALPRSASAGAIATQGARILAIQRRYAARVASLRAPAAWAAEVRELRRFDARRERILRRVLAAARSGNLARATRDAVALRELTGRANAVLLRLGLARCAFGGSSMPL